MLRQLFKKRFYDNKQSQIFRTQLLHYLLFEEHFGLPGCVFLRIYIVGCIRIFSAPTPVCGLSL